MHHICALSGRKQPQALIRQHPLAPSPSKMERGPGGEARDNQEYQALHCNLLPHVATGIMTSINYMQKSRIDEKTKLAASNTRPLPPLPPLPTPPHPIWL